MTKKKTVEQPEQMRLVPQAVPEWEDTMIPLDALPLVYEAPPKGLVDSVRQFGVLQPIIVQVDMTSALLERPGPCFYIIAGRRRTAAARKAGLERIPARILTNSAGDINPDTILLIENAERGPNVAAEARAVEALIAQGNDPKAISRATGMKIATVRKRMALKRLAPELFAALEAGRISPGAAEAAARLTMGEQTALLAKAEGKRITGDMVADRKRVTASGTIQATLAGVVAGMGQNRQEATPGVLYGRARVHLERFRLEVPEDAPRAILGALERLERELAAAEDWGDFTQEGDGDGEDGAEHS
jgi:ParB/RepB/Spo0J family partition protein